MRLTTPRVRYGTGMHSGNGRLIRVGLITGVPREGIAHRAAFVTEVVGTAQAMVVARHLIHAQGHGFNAAPLARVIGGQSGAPAGMDRGTAAHIRQTKAGASIATKGCPQQREQCGV